MKEIIFTEQATKPTAWYSQAVKVDRQVYLAGVCGDDRNTGAIMGDGDIQIETKYALENLKATIEAAGGRMEDIVKVSVYVKNLQYMQDFNVVYQTYFPENPPARIAMEISNLGGGANLELDAIAVLA